MGWTAIVESAIGTGIFAAIAGIAYLIKRRVEKKPQRENARLMQTILDNVQKFESLRMDATALKAQVECMMAKHGTSKVSDALVADLNAVLDIAVGQLTLFAGRLAIDNTTHSRAFAILPRSETGGLLSAIERRGKDAEEAFRYYLDLMRERELDIDDDVSEIETILGVLSVRRRQAGEAARIDGWIPGTHNKGSASR